jgi:hypothetical protein
MSMFRGDSSGSYRAYLSRRIGKRLSVESNRSMRRADILLEGKENGIFLLTFCLFCASL